MKELVYLKWKRISHKDYHTAPFGPRLPRRPWDFWSTWDPLTPILPIRKSIYTHLPLELLREIFLYSIESNQMESGHLASVCRHWRSVITSIASLWSTLRVGTWTERERVATWLERAYPKKVVIDTQRDRQMAPNALPFAALQDALASTSQWHELTISSFPPENLAGQLGFQVASPMTVLKLLHVAAECVHSLSFAHLLNLVPTEAPLSELRLQPLFASTHFLQPHWFPALKILTVLTVNGRAIHEQFELLPAFTQLQIFEADRLPLPFYELDTDLPLLCTLQKLHLRASSVQWMAGRQFPCLEECAILLPRHWGAVQQHEVQLPSCKKFTYHGYPMTTAQHFLVPQMSTMDLRSHDCKKQRVYQELRHLCTVDGRISKLSTLHLTFQCSPRVLIKVLKYLVPLQELILSIAHHSSSWKDFLALLAAKPSAKDWREWEAEDSSHHRWEQWCLSQTWCVNVLPHLKYLGIQCPKGFSQSEYLDNRLLLRLVGWSRAHLTPPLEYLKVWEGKGTTDGIVVDYISTGYPDRLLGISSKEYDTMIVRGIVTQRLVIDSSTTQLLQLHSTVLFRRLQEIKVKCFQDHEIPILPYLEQIKRLEIWHGTIPAYPLDLDLPLIHTLQSLRLYVSTVSWMLGRTFKALRELLVRDTPGTPENQPRHEGLRVNLPACTALTLWAFSVNNFRFLSCPNVQILLWTQSPTCSAIDQAALESLHDFLWHCSCLKTIEIVISQDLGLDSLFQLVLCDTQEQRVWRYIRSVEVKVWLNGSSKRGKDHPFTWTVGHERYYEKWWKDIIVTMEGFSKVVVRASM